MVLCFASVRHATLVLLQGLDATGYMINVAIIQCPVLSGNCCCLVLYRLCVPHVGFCALVRSLSWSWVFGMLMIWMLVENSIKWYSLVQLRSLLFCGTRGVWSIFWEKKDLSPLRNAWNDKQWIFRLWWCHPVCTCQYVFLGWILGKFHCFYHWNLLSYFSDII